VTVADVRFLLARTLGYKSLTKVWFGVRISSNVSWLVKRETGIFRRLGFWGSSRPRAVLVLTVPSQCPLSLSDVGIDTIHIH